MLKKAGFVIGVLACGAQVSEAQMLSNPTLKSAVNARHVGFSYAMSSLDYQAENFGEIEMDRKLFGFEVSSGINQYIDGFAQLGIMTSARAAVQQDSSRETLSHNSGFMLGAGARGVVHSDANGFVSAYGLLNYTQESFTGKLKNQDESSGLNTEIIDIHLGSVYNLNYAPDVKPYAGVELIFASEGKVQSSGGFLNQSRDLERENSLAIKFGANIDLDKSVVRPEVLLLGERTVSISGTMLY